MSETIIDLKKLKQKNFYSTLKDGLTELFAGFILFILGISIQAPAMTIAIGVTLIFFPQIVTKLKERSIYPRIGIIEIKPKEDPNAIRNGVLFILSALTIYFLLVFLLESDLRNIISWLNWLPILMSLILLAPTMFLIENSGKKIYILIPIISFSLAIVVQFIDGLQGYDKLTIYLLIIGLLSIIIGGIKYYYFIRHNPILLEDDVSIESEKDQ